VPSHVPSFRRAWNCFPVHETHGLDSWERLVQRFNSNADKESGKIVDAICREEIDHVRKGLKW
jgi:uncharacterized ferritin-like protein (DUF455 family)